MKAILVGTNSKEAEILSHELIQTVPSIQIDIVKTAEEALEFFRSGGGDWETVLLDSSVPGADAANLAKTVRNEKKSIAVIALVDGIEKEDRTDLLKAGVDRLVLKKPGYTTELSALLRQAEERPQMESLRRARKVRLLYAGNADQARRHLSRIPFLSVEPIAFGPDGTLQLPATGTSPGDLLIVDFDAAGTHIRDAAENIRQRAPGVPYIILTNPEDEEAAIRWMQAGAADCIARTERYLDRLIPAIEREIRLREQAREKASLKSREDRLRQIVESMPVGVAILALDGTFLAVNHAGICLLGASRPEQILGKCLVSLLPAEENARILAFLKDVSGWTNAALRIDWGGLDGSAPGIELRAVPMRKEGGGTPFALLTISHPEADRSAREELAKKLDGLTAALNESEARLQDLQNKYSLQQSKLESLLKESESRQLAAEQQQANLTRAAEDATTRHRLLLEEQHVERANWEQSRRILKEQCAKIEAVAQSLRLAQASLTETHRVEQEQWNRQRNDQEQKLETAGSRLARLSEAQDTERSQHEKYKQEMERQLNAAEEQRSALDAALQEAQSQIMNQAEEHAVERSRRDLERSEMEQKYRDTEEQRSALQTALQEAEFRFAALSEEYRAERSRLERVQSELEQKYQEAEERRTALQTALQEAETRMDGLKSGHANDLSQRDLAYAALEAKFQTAEKLRTALESALHDAEDRIPRLIEKHSAELSQREFAQRKSEQKYEFAEKQRMAVQNALRDSETSLAQLTEKHTADRIQWDRDRTEFEQRIQAAEKEHATALQSAIREAESRLAWISEQNQSKALQLEKLQKEADQLRADCKRFAAESVDSRGRYQRLSQFTSAGIILAARNGLVLDCNDIAARMFGYASAKDALEQATGNPFQIYAFEGALEARLQQDGKLENIEWTSLRRDGSLIRIQESATLVEAPAGEGLCVERILTDISKVRRLAEEIRRARRIESSGDLAATTIRSFEELCTSMTRSGKRLMETADDSPAIRQIAEAILNEANRGIKYARQFLSAVQKADRSPALLNLNDLLLGSDSLLRSLAGEDIDIQTNLAPRLGLVSADHNEMVQLIGSLLTTSRETLPLGGAISIETSNVEIDSPAPDFPAGLRPGIYVRMVFSADGCALQPERRTASIRAIVERMGGYMETVHDPKLGNIHTVFFPRVETCPGQTDVLSNTAGA